jgi:hypothetical protein
VFFEFNALSAHRTLQALDRNVQIDIPGIGLQNSEPALLVEMSHGRQSC